MTKKKILRKSNKPLTLNLNNTYSFGGEIKKSLSGANIGSSLMGATGDIGAAVGGLGNSLISGGLESGAGSTISNIGGSIGSALSSVNPLLGGIVSVGSGLLGGLTNKMFGSKLNQKKINEVNASNTGMNRLMVDNSSNDAIMDQWQAQNFGDNFKKSDIGKDGWFSHKAKNKYNSLRNEQVAARNRALTSFENGLESVDTQTDLNTMANYAAFGGFINTAGNKFEDGGNLGLDAVIKARMALDSHFGNPTARRMTNYDTRKYTFKNGEVGNVYVGSYDNYVTPQIQDVDGKLQFIDGPWSEKNWKRSEAQSMKFETPEQAEYFAKNYKRFAPMMNLYKDTNDGNLFDEGGNLYSQIDNSGQHGGNFSNGVRIIGNGGTHEENKYDGVPIGLAEDGNSNLVEQGEVIFNDYVFSNRLLADKKLLADNNLPSSYDKHSFADIAERLNQESSERPNDPISKNGLLSSMTRLQNAQETLKAQDQENNMKKHKFAKGGHTKADRPDLTATHLSPSYDGTFVKKSLVDIANANKASLPDTLNTSIGNYYPEKSKGWEGMKFDPTYLRYAPVVGSGINAITDMFGLTNKPNYENADLIGRSVNNLSTIDYNNVGNYLSYNPLDRNYYINKLNAQASAGRNALINQAGGNRAAAMAGILASDYGAQGQFGNLARQAEEYNAAQRERTEGFNRQTNMYNTEMGMKAAIANKQNEELRMRAYAAQAQMREAARAQSAAARSANFTNFFDSLGAIGSEEFTRNMINSNKGELYGISGTGKVDYKKKAKGGYLTVRKRK